MLVHGQRSELLPDDGPDGERLALDRVIRGLGVARRRDPASGNVTLRLRGHEVVLYAGKSLTSVDGDLRLLSGQLEMDGGRVLVPIDALPVFLEPLLDTPVRWHAGPRVLVIGRAEAPRIEVQTRVSGERVQVVLRASERVPFDLERRQGRVTVSIERDLVEVDFRQQRLTGGIVERVRWVGGRDNSFEIDLGPRFSGLDATEEPLALTLDFRADLETRAAADAPPGDPGAPAPGAEERTPVVVIDPGHGGSMVGAEGPGGTLEKDITLSIAHKLRSSIVSGLGYRVFLTRDGDVEVALDDRAPIANNYKADLFVSIHANSYRGRSAEGSEVYFLSYQASDDESRRVALAEGAVDVPPSAGEGDAGLSWILWDMAQAHHLEDSSRLATRIQEELASVTGSEGRGIKQAPFRVLVGAAMPAVLVEVAFLSNPDEEKLLASDAYQWRIAAALMRGIARFMAEKQAALGVSGR
jgi:N-acetylmuramoyl-L-alanine amidase